MCIGDELRDCDDDDVNEILPFRDLGHVTIARRDAKRREVHLGMRADRAPRGRRPADVQIYVLVTVTDV